MQTARFVKWFKDLSIDDVKLVGGKNASLGELIRGVQAEGVRIPDGFAVTAEAYWALLEQDQALEKIKEILKDVDSSHVEQLTDKAKRIRKIILALNIPPEISKEILAAYKELCVQYGSETDVAVRSSATAEDLPEASFAGQQETFLNVRGEASLIEACKNCFASLFTSRAISYREDKGFGHLDVGLSIGIQKMVRSDLASAGVMFSIDTETGFRDVVLISGAYGLGENVVKGTVNPDEFCVFKPTLLQGYRPIISKTLGTKKLKMVYQDEGAESTLNVQISEKEQNRFVLTDDEVLTLAQWACVIEKHYSRRTGKHTPMDIEWAKDGISGELFIVQARPETVMKDRDISFVTQHTVTERGEVITFGHAVGQKVAAGNACIIKDPKDLQSFEKGQILITENTDPDWEPIMKTAAAIVTDRGSRTSHAAIVSRELGIPCVVGCGNAVEKISPGSPITVSCAEGETGKVYEGKLPFTTNRIDLHELPSVKTKIAFNVASPDKAFEYSFLPNDGVGLLRIEFAIAEQIKIHPLAILDFESLNDLSLRREIEIVAKGYKNIRAFFVEKLAQCIGKIAAAFYPKPVIVRTSDFKSNEYAHLLGGKMYEPDEENPMIGWRGASRYYHSTYQRGFELECEALKMVRDTFGLSNVKIMIPFCRTVEEAGRVLAVMEKCGLKKGDKELEIYGMCEIPSNVLLADEFLEVFDGFSIGSNDLTQLTLGLDRDSDMVSELFDERNEAVKKLIEQVIKSANDKNKYIGICGDAPSTFPDFAAFLVRCGIGTISITPDALFKTRCSIAEEERRIHEENNNRGPKSYGTSRAT